EYDGTALTNADVEDKNANGLTLETGWVDGEGATYSFTGTITEEGEVPNAFTYTLKENTKESNYAIKKTEGTLKINPRTMYTLTIHYMYDITGGGNTAAPDYVRAYVIGEEYNVKSPDITGFKPNMDRVTGTLDEDTEITVLYTRQAYNLTIRYRYIGGGEAAPTFRTTAEYGYTYSRTSPVIAGYTASDRVISGRMPARDVEFIVYYSPNDDRVIIDDYGTPLGLGNLGLNAGETIE
ncbi:MAG: MucBP domain-containing protein, partial [Spirochaetales bacterium]|nr:MucBP domain-containing protein [Spirochaetales bacterium]